MSFLLGTTSPAARAGQQQRSGPPWFGWSPTSSSGWASTSPAGNGREADPSTFSWSLQKVAVWSCVTLTATIAEMLPLDVYSGEGSDRRPRPLPGWLGDLGGDGHGIHDWSFQFVLSGMLRGNVTGRTLDRDPRTGKPRLIALAHPDRARARRNPETGRVQWVLDGVQVDNSDDVWHKRFFPVPGAILGMSPIQQQAATIGLALSAQDFGSRWFADGGHPSGILTSDQPLDRGQAQEAKKLFLAALRGSREPLTLGQGWKYQAIQISPEESQFLQTQQYTAAECCRIFGPAYAEVFGYETGGSLTYANVEQRSLDLLTYAVDPWLVRLERALSDLLPQPQYVKFNRKALVKSDLITRYRAYEIALRNAFTTVNEVRTAEDDSPLPWGDDRPTSPSPTSSTPTPDPAGGANDAQP